MARGGKREGAGRPQGASTKVTADLKAAACQFTDDALNVLVEIMKSASHPAAARVAAAGAVLDRGHGKPKQAIVGGDDNDPPVTIRRIERVIVDPLAQDA